ncbi:MAG: hypothetical protein IIB71_12200 [Proteobacteria bacterium]|nr:hypothetical protein [Pseudomonadota bacterium]
MATLDEMSPQEKMLLQYEVEQFLYHEARLLDERKFEDWLALLTDDIHYWMPIRRTTMARDVGNEFTRPGAMAFFDDDKNFLQLRVKKLPPTMPGPRIPHPEPVTS